MRTQTPMAPHNPAPPTTSPMARRRWMDRLLGHDPAMRIRMTMATVATLLMLGSMGVVQLLVHAGYGHHGWAVWWSIASAAGCAVTLVLIRSGWSQRLPDPSLTQWQIRLAIASNAAAYVLLGPARGVTPVMLSLVLMFGIFGMTVRQLLGNLVYTLVLFAVAIAWVHALGEPLYSPALQWAYAVVIVLVLVGSTFVAVRLQRIRHRVARQQAQLLAALERIKHLAAHDELTGLINRRRMDEILSAELLRSERAGRALAVALLDLDWFKRINDTEGHAVGDEVLRAFAQTVLAHIRSTDVLARWGGEEFVLLLYDSHPDGDQALLERVRQGVENMRVPVGERSLQVTVSVGMARSVPDDSVPRLLERADTALYLAKSWGRNQVVVHGAPPDTLAAQTDWPSI